MTSFWRFWLPVLSFVCVSDCYRILVVFHVSARSHQILGNALARGLADAGHDVTMVSPFEDNIPPRNGSYRNVVIGGMRLQDLKTEHSKGKAEQIFDIGSMNAFTLLMFLNQVGYLSSKSLFEDQAFQKLLHSGEKFDVVIIEQAMSEAMKAIAWHFGAPLIMLNTYGASPFVNFAVGNPAPTSYIPNLLISATSDMTLWERVLNSAYLLYYQVVHELYVLPQQEAMVRQYFPRCPDIRSVATNVSIYLLNSHESVNQAVPHVPSMINIGGYHVQPSKKLPDDLQDYLDNSHHGVIYFSMGSNIEPSGMKAETKQAILRALGKLKEDVLWKWDEDDLTGKPGNVKIGKWFPQQDILAHPNVKLFITHGGLLSTIETVHHGVPVLALPVFVDQEMNAANAQDAGYAISLRFSDLTEEKFSRALSELLSNPKYRDNVKKRSKLIHDRPVKPLDLAVYWIEFVARHKGATHLRVAALDLPWYQYHLVDVVLVLSLIVSILIMGFYLFVKCICFRATRNPKEKIN